MFLFCISHVNKKKSESYQNSQFSRHKQFCIKIKIHLIIQSLTLIFTLMLLVYEYFVHRSLLLYTSSMILHDINSSRRVRWFLLCNLGFTWTGWTARCLGQAGRDRTTGSSRTSGQPGTQRKWLTLTPVTSTILDSLWCQLAEFTLSFAVPFSLHTDFPFFRRSSCMCYKQVIQNSRVVRRHMIERH